MIKSEIVIDQHYKDFSPMQFGSETCDPGHFFGPSVRTHWLLHYIVYGFGRFERDGISYSVKPGDIFVIPPYEKTYYEADQKKPWRYIWIGFTTDQSVPEQLLKPIIHCPSAGKIFEEMLQCEKMENGRTAFLCAKLWEFLVSCWTMQNLTLIMCKRQSTASMLSISMASRSSRSLIA